MKKDAPRKGVPKFDELMNPTLQALKRLGGSASIDELVPEIVKFLNLPQQVAEVPHGNTGRTELEYRAAWARTYLRNAGYLDNSERGVWALTPKGTQTESVDGRQIAREFALQWQAARAETGQPARLGSRMTQNPPPRGKTS
jgi:restriction system protein